jgi:hypothetical protein
VSHEETLRLIADWRRMAAECPYCAECRKEMANLAGMIPLRMVRHTDGEWEHITAEAMAAFFAVFNKYGEMKQDGREE